jgi:alcohol dehydrogenase class IV
MGFEFATSARIVFGRGAVAQAGEIARELGRRALVVTGRSPARAERLTTALDGAGLGWARFAVAEEPTLELARAGVETARREACDLVIACGGGSAIDAGKAIAALLGNGGDPLDYIEVIGKKKPLTQPSAPFVAIPTTAGTGSEVTKNAVLGSPRDQVKASLRSPFMLPRVAIVDPELLAGLPRSVIASSGLDALSQLIEPFVSARANPVTDGLAKEGMARSARALRHACERELDDGAREDLALASLLGGLCLANAGLGAVHGFAAPLGGMFSAPHGAVCAALLGAVMRANLRAASEREPGGQLEARYREVAGILTGHAEASAEDGIAWVEETRRMLEVPGLSAYGMTRDDVPRLVEKAKAASSMRANPIVLTDGELSEIALASL